MDSARYAYSGLERIFHERGRLAVCTSLIARDGGMRFSELQEACSLTDGNLSRHLHVLTEVGVVTQARERHGARMATVVRITPQGRERFLAYLDELEAVLRDARARSVTSLAPYKLSPAKVG